MKNELTLLILLLFFIQSKANSTIIDNGNDEGKYNKGLLSLYNMMDNFVEFVTPHSNNTLYDEIIIKSTFDIDYTKVSNWKFWTSYYPAITVCLVFGAIFAIFMLFFGFICCCTCCCRCCKCCGNCYDEEKMDNGIGLYAKNFLSIILLLFLLIILGGVICCFMTNKEINGMISTESPTNYNLWQSLQNALNQLIYYKDQLFKDLKSSLDTLKEKLMNNLHGTFTNLPQKLILSLFNQTNLSKINQEFQQLKVNLNHVLSLTNNLFNLLNNSNTALFNSTEKLIQINTYEKYINGIIDQLKVNDISEGTLIDNLSKEIIQNENLETLIFPKIDELISGINLTIDTWNSQIDLNYTNYLIDLINSYSNHIGSYENYRYYSFIAISSLILWIVACSLLGIFISVCSRSNSGSSRGAYCLTISLLFPIISILMIIQMIIFTSGTIAQSEICVGFVKHRNNSAIKLLDNKLSKFLNTSDFSVIALLNECQNKGSLIKALQFDNTIKRYTDIIENESIDINFDVNDQIKLISDHYDNQISNITKEKSNLFFDGLNQSFSILPNNSIFQEINNSMINLNNGVKNIINNIENLELLFDKYLNSSNDINPLLNKIFKNEIENIKSVIVNYLINFAYSDIFNCEPLYNIVFMVVTSICSRTIKPFNGFWFAFGWCLFFFLPLSFISICLINLYKRSFLYDDMNFSTSTSRDRLTRKDIGLYDLERTNQAFND